STATCWRTTASSRCPVASVIPTAKARWNPPSAIPRPRSRDCASSSSTRLRPISIAGTPAGPTPASTAPPSAKSPRCSPKSGTHIGPLCAAIHRRDGELGVRRILGVLGLVKKHGAPIVDVACAAALECAVADYRFVRRYLERHPAVPLTLRQVDPLIRELTHYRDVIAQKTQEEEIPR